MRVPVEAWDTVFVRARRRDVHPVLTSLGDYECWWPGAAVRPAGEAVVLTLRPPGRLSRPQHLRLTVTRVRPDLGARLRVGGDFDGTAEWYYLDHRAGVFVHYLLHAETRARGAARRLAAHRAAVRAGLHALKDGLERGRRPGDEPDPALLADQVAAKAAHDRRVARGTRVAPSTPT